MRSIYYLSGTFKLLRRNKSYHFKEIETSKIIKLNNLVKKEIQVSKNIFINDISSNLKINEVFFIPGNNPVNILNDNNFYCVKSILSDNNFQMEINNENKKKGKNLTGAFFVISEEKMYEELLLNY